MLHIYIYDISRLRVNDVWGRLLLFWLLSSSSLSSSSSSLSWTLYVYGWVLYYTTHLLSDDPVLSIFFLGGPYLFFHTVGTVVLVLVSGCFPFCLRVEATFIDSIWRNLLSWFGLFLLSLLHCLSRRMRHCINRIRDVRVWKSAFNRPLTTSIRVQINHQPDATIYQFIILTFIYSSTCFGRFPAHHQELNDCSGSLWFYLRIVVTVVLCSW